MLLPIAKRALRTSTRLELLSSGHVLIVYVGARKQVVEANTSGFLFYVY